MAAPAAPVVTIRTAYSGAARLRWPSVATATTYRVYRSAVDTGQSYNDSAGGKNEAVVQCGPGEALTVTALNVGLEESGASNTVSLASAGTNNSFPAGPPRGPYNSNPFG